MAATATRSRRQRPGNGRAGRSSKSYHLEAAPSSAALLRGSDCGAPIVVHPAPFVAAGREPGWGSFLDSFLGANQAAFRGLGLEPQVVTGREGVRLELHPGLRVGAVPLRSAVTGKVAGGVVIRPRFGWTGIGSVLSQTGWMASPEFLDLPLVPGSGREVPPWVLAGPVLQRLANLLEHLRRGYRERVEVRTHPRGQIQWNVYIARQLQAGQWHHLPCRFSELDTDSRLRQAIRWTLERLRVELLGAGGNDALALKLASHIVRLLEQLADVTSRRPTRNELELQTASGVAGSDFLREGLRAMGWIVDERGLGGGRTSDGLAWNLPLEVLWERYVEHIVRDEARRSGGQVRVGRSGETTVPLRWSDGTHRALSHLVPDFVVHRADGIEIVDAKYKSHYADLDETRWATLEEAIQASMRADIHQVLAYAATCGSSDRVKASLIYPVRQELFERLQRSDRAQSRASIYVGSREVTLCLRAIPFGSH